MLVGHGTVRPAESTLRLWPHRLATGPDYLPTITQQGQGCRSGKAATATLPLQYLPLIRLFIPAKLTTVGNQV